MSAEPLLDFDALLRPISEEMPSGESLREHPELSREFYAVRQARNAAMDAERALARAAVVPPEERDSLALTAADWSSVVEQASALLCDHSKDLWVVSWLIEGLTREAGIAGLRDGFHLCREMSEQFWDSIHPRPDEDDGYGLTVAQLAGLDKTLSSAVEATSVLADDPRWTWAGYRLALDLEQLDPEERANRIEEGALTLQHYQEAVRHAPREQLEQTQAELGQAIEECKQLVEVLDRLCGKDESGYPLGPSTSELQRCLERLTHDFEEMTAGLLTADPSTEGDPADQEGELSAAAAGGAATPGLTQRPVASRDEALQHLLRVADFFRKTEPHSPVSYALEQAVRWGRMPLPELLKDLVSDEDVLAQVFKRMGIAQPESSADDD
ncbi:MAG: type VI secretion system protein TssA [Planctomycetales bacterium]|nr:type VI secretion system protein TssA [Planctomycetales bacterium]